MVSYITKNIDRLARHVLIEKDSKIQFSLAFLSNTQLPGNLNDFRTQLKSKLNFDFNTLSEYQFDISNFPKLDLPSDSISNIKDDIKSFLGHLVFAVNQPNEIELDKIIKSEMGAEFNNIDRKNIYSRFQKKMLNWMKAKEGKFFSYEEGKAFFEKMKEEILGSIWFDVKKPVDLFTGRKQELSDLHGKIQRGSERVTVISQMTSVSGLGAYYYPQI